MVELADVEAEVVEPAGSGRRPATARPRSNDSGPVSSVHSAWYRSMIASRRSSGSIDSSSMPPA